MFIAKIVYHYLHFLNDVNPSLGIQFVSVESNGNQMGSILFIEYQSVIKWQSVNFLLQTINFFL